MATPAWQRKEGQNPSGGLNDKGRASYKAQTGGTLKAPVKGRPTSPDQMRRKGSFLSRMGGSPGPMKDEKGRPTRKALALKAWGASNETEAKSMGRRLLEQYAKQKADKK
jgi:hypothetical protein